MPLKSILNIPNSIMEQLHCSLCKGYLSCGPVRLLPDGSCICGRCTFPNADVPIYRVLALETVLSKTSFPCRFNQRGCIEYLMFGQAILHESHCLYRSFTCPSVPFTQCIWEGSAAQMLAHFNKKHMELVQSFAEFKLQLNEDSQGILMLVKNDSAFLVKFNYDKLKCALHYDIRYCKNETQNVTYKIQLYNGLDRDCSISLKSRTCYNYNEAFYNLNETSMLNLSNYLQNLDNPATIAVQLMVNQTGCDNATKIDQELLHSLKCGECHHYLIPPLYDLDGHTICCDCAKTHHRCIPSKNKEALNLITNVNYPCRWRDCKLAFKSDQYKSHELTCNFRHYDCFFPSCQITFKLESVVDHLQSHRAQFMPDSIVYKIQFSQVYGFKHIFTIKDNVIILIQHSVFDSGESLTHRVALFSSQPTEILGNIYFEHQHCKLKSKAFAVVSKQNTDISLTHLPPCYKDNEELKAVVHIHLENRI